MIFLRYGISMERLEEKHLEMVRQWRNNDLARLQMQYKEIVSPQSQVEWFTTLNKQDNWYFIASKDERSFGVFNLKNIDWSKPSGEAGAFVCDSIFEGHADSALAILALMDFGFFVLGLTQLEAKYNPIFTNIELLNKQLGYTIAVVEDDGFVRATVTVKEYLLKTNTLRIRAEKSHPGIKISGEDEWLTNRIKKMQDANCWVWE